jgi:anti-sigma factor ChrR (cupin superfamily)
MSASGKPLQPTQPSAGFIRYAPGAAVPTHRHPGYEHIIVLSGAQSDDRGVYERGTCVMSPPGTSHGVASERGCLVLAIWNQSVEVVGG